MLSAQGKYRLCCLGEVQDLESVLTWILLVLGKFLLLFLTNELHRLCLPSVGGTALCVIVMSNASTCSGQNQTKINLLRLT